MGSLKLAKYDIQQLCYELYKIDWLKQNVSATQHMVEYRRFFLNKIMSEEKYRDENYTFDKHIETFGYGTRLYVSFEEFCETAFLNKEYINYLLGNKAVYRHENLRQIWNLYLDCLKI